MGLYVFNYYCEYKQKEVRFKVQIFLLGKLSSKLRKYVIKGYFSSCSKSEFAAVNSIIAHIFLFVDELLRNKEITGNVLLKELVWTQQRY